MFETHVGQLAYTLDSLVVGLPMMTATYENALELMSTLPYKTYGIGAPRDAACAAAPAVLVPAPLVPCAAMPAVPATLVPAPLVPCAAVPAVPAAPLAAPCAPMPLPPTPAPLKRFLNKAIFKVKAGLAADNYLLYR